MIACSGGGRRGDNNNGSLDLSVSEPTDLGVDPGDGGGKSDGKPSADQAAPSTLTGTIELQRQGFAFAYFAYVQAGAGSSAGPGFTCVSSGDCQACWNGPIVKQDLSPVDLWRPEDLTPPTYDLLEQDLWQPDLKQEVDLATVMANAGTIAVTNVNEPFELTTNSAGTYRTYSGGALWTDPVMVHVAAAGTLDVPAFEAELETPAAGSITEAPPVVDRSQPYTLKWPKADGILQTTITTYYYLGYSTASVFCSFDRSAGQATIPASLLSHLYPTVDDYVTQVTFRSGTTVKLTSGKAKIQINATVSVPAPSGQDPFTTL